MPTLWPSNSMPGFRCVIDWKAWPQSPAIPVCTPLAMRSCLSSHGEEASACDLLWPIKCSRTNFVWHSRHGPSEPCSFKICSLGIQLPCAEVWGIPNQKGHRALQLTATVNIRVCTRSAKAPDDCNCVREPRWGQQKFPEAGPNRRDMSK